MIEKFRRKKEETEDVRVARINCVILSEMFPFMDNSRRQLDPALQAESDAVQNKMAKAMEESVREVSAFAKVQLTPSDFETLTKLSDPRVVRFGAISDLAKFNRGYNDISQSFSDIPIRKR